MNLGNAFGRSYIFSKDHFDIDRMKKEIQEKITIGEILLQGQELVFSFAQGIRNYSEVSLVTYENANSLPQAFSLDGKTPKKIPQIYDNRILSILEIEKKARKTHGIEKCFSSIPFDLGNLVVLSDK